MYTRHLQTYSDCIHIVSRESLVHCGRVSCLAVAHILVTVNVGRVHADLVVVLLERLAELALFHALADVPVHESALGVHHVELELDAREDLRDRRRVRDHAHGALHGRHVAPRAQPSAAGS